MKGKINKCIIGAAEQKIETKQKNTPSKLIVPFLSKSYILNRMAINIKKPKPQFFRYFTTSHVMNRVDNSKPRTEAHTRPDHLLNNCHREMKVSDGKSTLIIGKCKKEFVSKIKEKKKKILDYR